MLIFMSEFALILDVQNPNPSFCAVFWQLDFYRCLSSQPSLISIFSNANFSPVSSPKSFSHMTIKRSQIMIKACVLGLSDLCLPFWTNFQCRVLNFYFFLSTAVKLSSKYQILFQNIVPRIAQIC